MSWLIETLDAFIGLSLDDWIGLGLESTPLDPYQWYPVCVDCFSPTPYADAFASQSVQADTYQPYAIGDIDLP